MLGLIIAIIIFNYAAFKTNKKLNGNQIAHLWAFTLAFQMSFDIYVDVKYHGYWYFSKQVDWSALPAHTFLIPPVNMMFVNWYPFRKSIWKKIRYYIYWVAVLMLYEAVTLLPEPWGYFHYGWWNWRYTLVIDPVLLLILIAYYKKFIRHKP